MWLDPEKLGLVAVIGNSVVELVRLGVLLPLRHLVVVPALWVGLRLKDALKPPSVLLRELAEQEGGIEVSKLVGILKAANGKGQSVVVVDFFERECLGGRGDGSPLSGGRDGREDSSSSAESAAGAVAAVETATEAVPAMATVERGRVPVNADVVKEYLIALVKTGRIDAYGDDALRALSGQSYASLSVLLRDLVEAADGRGPRKDRRPGETALWPLHIAVDGGLAAGRGQATALQSLFWFFSTLAIVSLMWMVGAVTARRVVTRAGQGQGQGQSHGIGQDAHHGVAASLEPKEYVKENMPQKSVKSFADVKGCDEAIGELKEIVEYLKKPEKFVKLGGTPAEGCSVDRSPWDGKDAPGSCRRGGGQCALFLQVGIGVRRDVCWGRVAQGACVVRGCEEKVPMHRVHRRD